MSSIKKFKLFESPDHILIKDNNKNIRIKYYEENCAKPFAFSPLMKNGRIVYDDEGCPVIDKLWVGEFGEGHSDDCTLADEKGRRIDYDDLLYKGRLWFNYEGINLNIISFWDSLEKEEMERVIKELAYETGINFSNWSIDGGIEFEECEHCHGEGYTEEDGDCEYCNGEGCFKKTELIPLKSFKGGINIGEEEKAIHLMSWEEKQKMKREKGWGRGWGSDMTAWDSKNPLQWRQAKYQEKVNYNMKYIQKFENYVKGPKNISFMALDWDDNILSLKTKIHLEKMVNGKWEPYDVSTAEFAEIRSLVNGKDYRMLDNDPKKTYGDFGDYNAFLNDTREALASKSFGPSFRAFIKCLVDGNLFAIVTARSASSKAIRAGVEVIVYEYLSPEQQDEMISNLMMYNELYGKNPDSIIENYLNWCDYFGVNSPEFKEKYGKAGDVSSPEEGKKTALKIFADKCQKLCKEVGAFARLGFSDDDIKNLSAIKKYFNEIASEYNITFSVFDTSDPKIKGGIKTKIER